MFLYVNNVILHLRYSQRTGRTPISWYMIEEGKDYCSFWCWDTVKIPTSGLLQYAIFRECQRHGSKFEKIRVYYYMASPSPHPPSLALLATSCMATSYQRPFLATLSKAYPTYSLTLTPNGFIHSTYHHMQSFS